MEFPVVMLMSLKFQVYPADAMERLASRVMELTISSQSMELEATIWSSVPQLNLPVLVSQRSLEVVASQSEVRPDPYVLEAEAKPVTQRLPDMDAPASK